MVCGGFLFRSWGGYWWCFALGFVLIVALGCWYAASLYIVYVYCMVGFGVGCCMVVGLRWAAVCNVL